MHSFIRICESSDAKGYTGLEQHMLPSSAVALLISAKTKSSCQTMPDPAHQQCHGAKLACVQSRLPVRTTNHMQMQTINWHNIVTSVGAERRLLSTQTFSLQVPKVSAPCLANNNYSLNSRGQPSCSPHCWNSTSIIESWAVSVSLQHTYMHAHTIKHLSTTASGLVCLICK